MDANFVVRAEADELLGDGADCTRVWFMVTDEHGNARNTAMGAIQFEIDGPGELIGDNPFALAGGRGAVWVRSRRSPGQIRLTARHATLGERTVTIRVPRAVREVLSAEPSPRESGRSSLAASGAAPATAPFRGPA
jgi:beta-galactosidase